MLAGAFSGASMTKSLLIVSPVCSSLAHVEEFPASVAVGGATTGFMVE